MRRLPRPDVNDLDLAEVLYALSDPIRLEIVKKLAATTALTCGVLCQDRPKSSMSHHFRILRSAGIVESKAEGKEFYNSLRSRDLEKKFPGLLKSILKAL
ncbi:MAG: helix-turn-helix domain-containing protein [Chthoniobacteraceae bacterium]